MMMMATSLFLVHFYNVVLFHFEGFGGFFIVNTSAIEQKSKGRHWHTHSFGVRFLQFAHVGWHFDSEVNFVGILANNLKLDVLGFSVLISHVGCFRIEGLSSINDLNSTSLTRKPAKWVASLKYGGINNKYDRVTRYQACNDAIWKLLLKCAKTLSKSADYGAKEPNWRISIWEVEMPICIRKYSSHLIVPIVIIRKLLWCNILSFCLSKFFVISIYLMKDAKLDKSSVVFTKNKSCFKKMDIIDRNRTVKTGCMRTFLTFLSVGKIFDKGCTQQREFQRNLKIVTISYAYHACVLMILC